MYVLRTTAQSLNRNNCHKRLFAWSPARHSHTGNCHTLCTQFIALVGVVAGVGAITYSIGQIQLYWLLPLTLSTAGLSLGMANDILA